MKNKILTFVISGIIMLTQNACTKDYTNPENDIFCTINYQSHSKNTQYQMLIDNYTKKGFVGLTLLIDNPAEGLWIGSSGYADIENNIKMTPCHYQHTASIYKTYIAVIIMQLVDEGKIELDGLAKDYLTSGILNNIPNGNEVTVRELLQHRSGIPDIFDQVDFLTDFFNNPTKAYSIEELLQYINGQKALSAAGTEFYYSDTNFALLTLLINEIDGNYVQSFKQRIFQPLNLTETYFLNKTGDAPAGLADSYWDRYGDGKIENISDVQIALTSGLKGTDGIVTTANDMKIFIQAIANATLVSETMLSEMTEFLNVPETAQEQHGIIGYGFGLMQVKVNQDIWYGHFGSHIGSAAIALYNPSKNITIVVFQNTGTFFSDKIKPIFFNQLIKDIENIALKTTD